jgi:hypothetical protein
LSRNDSSGDAPASTGISSIYPTRKLELDSMVEAGLDSLFAACTKLYKAGDIKHK